MNSSANMSEVNGTKPKNKKRRNRKQTDVMCWNCFTSEDGDNDIIDIEPIPLPKVREEHREKLKVYSFLASELSKPKAVSLKQKMSEPYKIGKKLDTEILKQQLNTPDSKNTIKESNSLNHNTESCQRIPIEKNITECVTTYENDDKIENNINKDEAKWMDNLKDFSDKRLEHQNSTLLPQEKNTMQHVMNVISFGLPEMEKNELTANESKLNNFKQDIANGAVEIKNQNNLLSQDSLLISQQRFSNQELQNQCEESYYTSEKKFDNQRRSFEQSSPTTMFKLAELEKFTPLLTSNLIRNISDEKSIMEDSSQNKEISSPSKTQTKAPVTPPPLKKTSHELSMCKPYKESDCSSYSFENKPANVTREFPKITPIKLRNIDHTYSKIPVLNRSPVKVPNETTIKDNLIIKSDKLNKEKSVSTKNIGEKSVGEKDKSFKGDTQENTFEDKTSLVPKDQNFTDSDKIVHKVQILTSTPKEKCIVVNETSLKDDIVKSKLNSPETKEEIAVNSDKTDNASSNGSESGYTGSLATVQEFVIAESQEEFKENEDFNNQVKDMKKNSTSSLYSPNIVKKPPTHSSSLSTGINNLGKRPIKSLRWSTLSMVPRSVSFGDEVYMSEAVSPGHATLPRRSNSPLPHERDVDRDRFPINRSGLQARSESMASVYSGAGEGLRGSVTVRGEVQFSLLYNYRLGALEVGVKRCRDLAPVDVKRNRSDPYVKVYLLPDKSKAGKRKTKVKKNTLNPVFEETLSFVQPLASLSARTLWLSAWHADMFGRNDFLGEVTLPLADVVFDDPAPMWYKLHERTEQFDEQQGSRGDLIIGLKFELADAARGKGTLHVLVKEAKNLVATKPNGLADVFCKSYLLPERGRLAKQKTSVVRRTLNPRWEHTFTYRGLTLQELATRALELSLWDRDRLASNDFMGAVRLSLATGTYMGASVNWMDSVGKEITLWQNMMQQPNLWVEGSLPLRPQLIN